MDGRNPGGHISGRVCVPAAAEAWERLLLNCAEAKVGRQTLQRVKIMFCMALAVLAGQGQANHYPPAVNIF